MTSHSSKKKGQKKKHRQRTGEFKELLNTVTQKSRKWQTYDVNVLWFSPSWFL